MSSSLKPLEHFSPDFTRGLMSKGYWQFVRMVPHRWTRWPPQPYVIKKKKKQKKKLLITFFRTKKALWVRIRHTNKYVTNVLHMRTIVRICNSYIFVWMPHVEIYTCANNTKSSHLIKLRRKIDTVALCLWYRIEIVHQTPRWSGSTLFLKSKCSFRVMLVIYK